MAGGTLAGGARLIGVGKRYGSSVALEDFSLDIEEGELVVVVGPSGCGKSTLLRLIAGLEDLGAGEVHVGGRRVDSLPPQRRDVAMVFQSYALYPHMTVRGNVEFPLKMRGAGPAERREKVEHVASLLEIDALLDRRPAALSGGQRQRVALARALVREPALFLLDEPLSNLDARLRTSVRQHIREVQRRLGVTTLYVTHDQTEAMTLGHRVVVLDAGRIQMVAPPLEAYRRPANVFVAGFLGSPPMNLVPGHVEERALVVGDQRLDLGAELAERLGAVAGPVVVGMRAESFVAESAEPGLVVAVDADTIEALGSETVLRARLGGEEIAVRLGGVVATPPASLVVPTSGLQLFSARDGRRLGP